MDSNKLCKALGLDFGTLKSFIDALVKSRLLLEVKSYSEKFAVSPSLRVIALKGVIPLNLKDYIALTFLQEFKEREFDYGEISLGHDPTKYLWNTGFLLRDLKIQTPG
jgi:hypothetical protein